MGVTRSAVGIWESPDKKNGPTRSNLTKFAEVMGVPLDWLLNDESTLDDMRGWVSYPDPRGEGFIASGTGALKRHHPRVNAGLPTPMEYARTGYIRIQRLNVEAAAGVGVINDDYPEVLDLIDIAESRVRAFFSRMPAAAELSLIQVRGDSMSPDFEDGDAVIADVGKRQFSGDGVYLFALNGQLLLKRLQMLPDGLRVISTNPRYEPYTIPTDEIEQLRIVGRVGGVLCLRDL